MELDCVVWKEFSFIVSLWFVFVIIVYLDYVSEEWKGRKNFYEIVLCFGGLRGYVNVVKIFIIKMNYVLRLL